MTNQALRAQRLKSDLWLLSAALIWGSAFAVCRVAAGYLGPFLFNGVRFLVGMLVMLPLAGRGLRRMSRLEVLGGALAGALLFGASAFQQAGLSYTTAGKAGFITGLYVVLVPLLLALVWKQWPRWLAWIASLLAAAGLYLLSGAVGLALAPGDGLELLGALLYALHVITIGRVARGVEVVRLSMVQYLVCGLLSLAVGLVVDRATIPALASAWWAILYTGILSIGMGYTLQVVGQKHAPPADAAVILSLEAVFAALGGWLALGERLTGLQLVGCGLMLGGMLLAQARVQVDLLPQTDLETKPV